MAPAEIQVSELSQNAVRSSEADDPCPLRTQDIEEFSNRVVIHRLSMALVPWFVRLNIKPNTVSFFGAMSGLCAAFFYFQYENVAACVLGFLFMVAWHVFDGADGQLARRTGQVSPLGFIIDGACDYITFILVYCAFGLALMDVYGSGVWVLIIGAGAGHAMQAAAFELQRESYIRWTQQDAKSGTQEGAAVASSSAFIRLAGHLYRSLQEPFRPLSHLNLKRIENGVYGQLAFSEAADAYRTQFRRPVLAWSILSANNRTIAIFVFCLAGFPVGYFIYEVCVLTFVLAGLIALNKRAEAKLISSLANASNNG